MSFEVSALAIFFIVIGVICVAVAGYGALRFLVVSWTDVRLTNIKHRKEAAIRDVQSIAEAARDDLREEDRRRRRRDYY